MNITITPAIEKQLSDIASITNTDVKTVLESILLKSVPDTLLKVAAVQEAMDDFEAGRIYDHDAVIEEELDFINEKS